MYIEYIGLYECVSVYIFSILVYYIYMNVHYCILDMVVYINVYQCIYIYSCIQVYIINTYWCMLYICVNIYIYIYILVYVNVYQRIYSCMWYTLMYIISIRLCICLCISLSLCIPIYLSTSLHILSCWLLKDSSVQSGYSKWESGHSMPIHTNVCYGYFFLFVVFAAIVVNKVIDLNGVEHCYQKSIVP